MIDANEFQLTIISIIISYLLIGFVYCYNKQVSNSLNYFNPLIWFFLPSLLIIKMVNKINQPSWFTFILFVPCYILFIIGLGIVQLVSNSLEFE